MVGPQPCCIQYTTHRHKQALAEVLYTSSDCYNLPPIFIASPLAVQLSANCWQFTLLNCQPPMHLVWLTSEPGISLFVHQCNCQCVGVSVLTVNDLMNHPNFVGVLNNPHVLTANDMLGHPNLVGYLTIPMFNVHPGKPCCRDPLTLDTHNFLVSYTLYMKQAFH